MLDTEKAWSCDTAANIGESHAEALLGNACGTSCTSRWTHITVDSVSPSKWQDLCGATR